jgi:hypothetical protein
MISAELYQLGILGLFFIGCGLVSYSVYVSRRIYVFADNEDRLSKRYLIHCAKICFFWILGFSKVFASVIVAWIALSYGVGFSFSFMMTGFLMITMMAYVACA